MSAGEDAEDRRTGPDGTLEDAAIPAAPLDGRPGDRAGPDRDDDHLADLPDGSGCTEIWEHLSAGRGEG